MVIVGDNDQKYFFKDVDEITQPEASKTVVISYSIDIPSQDTVNKYILGLVWWLKILPSHCLLRIELKLGFCQLHENCICNTTAVSHIIPGCKISSRPMSREAQTNVTYVMLMLDDSCSKPQIQNENTSWEICHVTLPIFQPLSQGVSNDSQKDTFWSIWTKLRLRWLITTDLL